MTLSMMILHLGELDWQNLSCYNFEINLSFYYLIRAAYFDCQKYKDSLVRIAGYSLM